MSVFSHKNPPTDDSISDTEIIKNEENPLAEIVRFSIIAILIVIPIRMFIAQPFIVSGASMDDTFNSGQYLIVDQLSYYFEQPTRGEVVIFRYPRDPAKFFIKRIIGLPGDTVKIEDSVVTIFNDENPAGFVIDESYVKSMQPAPLFSETLGEREYFVMGDNRDQSSDSRSWGVLQEERIVGRALFRLYPPSLFGLFPGAIEPVVDASQTQS